MGEKQQLLVTQFVAVVDFLVFTLLDCFLPGLPNIEWERSQTVVDGGDLRQSGHIFQAVG